MTTMKAYQLTSEQWDCVNQLVEVLASTKSLAIMGKSFSEEHSENPALSDYFNAICHLLDSANTLCNETQKIFHNQQNDSPLSSW